MPDTTVNHPRPDVIPTSARVRDDREVWEAAVVAALTGNQAELDRVLERSAERLAREICSREAHRGGPCRCAPSRDSDDTRPIGTHSAYDVAETELVMKWLYDGAKGRHRAWQLWLSRGAPLPFSVFDDKVLAIGRTSDVERKWNPARGLPAKSNAVERIAPDALAAIVADLDAVGISQEVWDGLAGSVRRKAFPNGPDGMLPVQDPRLWLDALYNDAFQPAPELIDAERVTRFLTYSAQAAAPAERGSSTSGERWSEADLVDAVHAVAVAMDDLLARHVPDAYDALLVCARSQTRPVDVLVAQSGLWLDDDM
jgi:hypothetical protein